MPRFPFLDNQRRCFAFSVLVLFATTTVRADEYKSPLMRMDLAEGDSVVFLGDSITHQCLYTQYVEDFYYTRYPGRKIKFHNAGVGGATARDALDRFDRDVAAYKPKYVTVLLGMNDGGYKPYDDGTFQTYRTGMTELVTKIREIGAVPILMTPTMYDARAARPRGAKNPPLNIEMYNSTLAYYGAWLRETAVEQGAGFVDMYSLLNNLTLRARETDPAFTLIKDAVHPDPPGQLVMAFALLHDLDAGQGGLFDIRAEVGAAPEVKVSLKSPTGGNISGPRWDAASLEFTFGASALPFAIPAEAEPGARLVYLGHSLDRGVLSVTGLPKGSYELTIDGQAVGDYDNAALAQGIELEENAKTPDYRQALQVAELNKIRNEGPVRALRNEWSQMQQFYRLQRAAKANPDNADLAKNAEAQAKKVEGLEERIARQEEAAAEIERKILEIVPAPHKYRLAKVEPRK